MAYRAPGVTVTQEFVNALPALASFALPNVNVGPAFQVVKKRSAGNYASLLLNLTYPGQIAGTFVDTSSDPSDLVNFPVDINLKNTVVRIKSSVSTGTVSGGNLNQITDATLNVFQDIVAGDVVVVAGSLNGNDGSYTVRAKIDNNTLQVNETFAAAETTLNYTVRRNIGSDGSLLNIPTSTAGVVVDANGVTVPAALTTTVQPFGSVPILSAEVLLSYRALRVEKSADVAEYKKTAELQADFGLDQIVPENVVVFAAYLALNNSVTATNLLALPQDYLTDEVLAYSKAFDVLALTEMYAISVMTQNTAVHTSLKSHVNGYSVPEQKLERVGIFNRKLVTTAVVVDTKADGATNGTGLILTSASSQFVTDGVVPGMFINVSAPTNAVGRYKINSVDSQTQVTLAVAVAGTNPASGVSFAVDKDLSKSQQASVLASYAAGIASRRCVMTWPDVVKIPAGNEIRTLPGYFLNCAVGALTTGLPTQQGLTNLSVSLYQGVVHSTKYFDKDQLNAIADGGVMIFVQEVLDQTPLFIRHQLTTDRTAIKFQEYSVTKNVDFIAKFVRINHKQFIGQYNIVDSTFDDLKTNAKGILTYLAESTKLPKIGGVIRDGKLASVVQDPVNIDTITERYTLNIPIPLNNLDITIVV